MFVSLLSSPAVCKPLCFDIAASHLKERSPANILKVLKPYQHQPETFFLSRVAW